MTDLIRATNFVNSMHDPSKPHNLDVIYLSSMTNKKNYSLKLKQTKTTWPQTSSSKYLCL